MTQATYDHHSDWDRPRRGRGAGWLAVLLVVALAITLAGVFPFRQLIAQQRQVETAQDQLTALQQENFRLEQEAATLQTPAEIERIAREQFGVVRPGETAFAVNETPTRPAPAPEPAAGPADDRTLVEKVWDFLTGRDLVPDG